MSDLVPAQDIEEIVGQKRHNVCHYGRAVSAEETLYILHSHGCKDSGIDLRECEYSIALDRGLNMEQWRGFEDEAVVLYVEDGRLHPLGAPRAAVEERTQAMSKHVHHIDEGRTAVVCTAPANADCRKRSHCDSEGWYFDAGCTGHDGKHPALPGSRCWMTEYINSIELTETFEDYENPPEIIPGAAIDLEFIGRDEGCCWAYAEVTP